jgi:hypothetical protein
MSQRNVELFIGRLLTDSELRRRFMVEPRFVIDEFCEQGWELSRGEVVALHEMDVKLWFLAEAGLPSRLQRCSSRSGKE